MFGGREVERKEAVRKMVGGKLREKWDEVLI